MPNKPLQPTSGDHPSGEGGTLLAPLAADRERSAAEEWMSLVVSAFWTDPATGESCEFTDWEDGHHMAGVERARTDLWGSGAFRRRGATFLPQLANSDLWVGPGELPAFVAEVRALLADMDGLRAEMEREEDCTLPHYLANFLRAAEYAAARGGGVMIT